MLHLVTADGKYHGDIETMEEARAHVAKQKQTNVRALSDNDWAQVKANPDKRSELCGTMGEQV